MQKKPSLDKLSGLRAALRDALKELETTLEVAFERSALVKGNVYELARKCGKPTCVCAEGQLHRSMVLSWSHQGKTRLMTIPTEKLDRLRSSSEQYQRYRRARARVSEIFKQILKLLDQIEKLRRGKASWWGGPKNNPPGSLFCGRMRLSGGGSPYVPLPLSSPQGGDSAARSS